VSTSIRFMDMESNEIIIFVENGLISNWTFNGMPMAGGK
jgi:hypothetical protein